MQNERCVYTTVRLLYLIPLCIHRHMRLQINMQEYTHTEAEAQMYLSNQHIHIHKSNKLFLAGGCMWLSHQRAVESDVLGPRPTRVFN